MTVELQLQLPVVFTLRQNCSQRSHAVL